VKQKNIVYNLQFVENGIGLSLIALSLTVEITIFEQLMIIVQ